MTPAAEWRAFLGAEAVSAAGVVLLRHEDTPVQRGVFGGTPRAEAACVRAILPVEATEPETTATRSCARSRRCSAREGMQ